MRCCDSYRRVSLLGEVLRGLLAACPCLLKRPDTSLVSGIFRERVMSLLYESSSFDDMFFASAERYDLLDTLRDVLGALHALWR